MMRRLFLPLLLVSCAPKVPGQAPRDPGDLLYTVQFGDTLTAIAARYDVPGGYPALAKHNELWNADWIYESQRLRIPSTKAARRELPAWPNASTPPPLEAAAMGWLAAPRPAQVAGCIAAACVELSPGTNACTCERGRGDDLILLTRPGAEPLSWPVSLPSEPSTEDWNREGGLLDLTVARIDLDADGDLEHLIAHRLRTDDFQRSWWTVALVEDPGQPSPPLTFTLGNFGEGTAITTSGPRSELWLTSWEEIRGEGAWQTHHYLVGRRYAYDDGVLKTTDSPPVGRRLYYSYQPGQHGELGTPVADLRDPRVECWSEEPVTWGNREVQTADVRAVATTADGPLLTLAIDGQEHQWRPSEWPRQRNGYARIGEARTGRLFPVGYDPGDLEGSKLLVVDYDGHRVLWR